MVKLICLITVLAEQNKTNQWLAEQVGSSACIVSQWFNNRVQLDLNTLEKLPTSLMINENY